jgi:hypothetical protein
MGKAPPTRVPDASSDYYEYNKAGQPATPQERARMRGRDRAREKNTLLAERQMAGQLRAERRAAKRMTSDRTEPLSVLRYSPTYNAAEAAMGRRSKRAESNFKDGVTLERAKRQLTAKALKMQEKAKERKSQGKTITPTMESNFQEVRKQIAKIDKSLAIRRRAFDVVGESKRRMEINTKDRYRW